MGTKQKTPENFTTTSFRAFILTAEKKLLTLHASKKRIIHSVRSLHFIYAERDYNRGAVRTAEDTDKRKRDNNLCLSPKP